MNYQNSQQLTIQQALSRAKKAGKKGKIADAVELYTAVLQHQPNHPIAKKRLRELQKKLPNNQAVQVTTENLSQGQINSLANLYQSGQMIKTEQACRELLQAYPQSLVVMNVLGSALRGQGKLQEAVQTYNRAIQLKPNVADTYANRGNTLKDLGRLDEALQNYDKAIQLKPDFAEAHSNLGATLKELGRLKEAEASYRKAIALKPDYADAHNNLGITLQELGRSKDAEASLRQALALIPDYAVAHSNLGITLKELGRLDEAVASCDKAIQLKPDFAEAYTNRGVALKGLGRLNEAVASYDKAIQLHPNFYAAYYNRGDLLAEHALLDAEQLRNAIDDFDRSKTSMGRARTLELLYKVGRYDLFHERLSMLPESDHTERRIAAISAFAADQLDHDNPHLFCKNPLEFLHINHVSGISGPFLNDLIEELKARKAQWEPHGKTTHSGFQTKSDLFVNPTQHIRQLEEIIKKEIRTYYAHFKSQDCLFMSLWPKTLNLSGWFVRLLSQGYQGSHMHPAGWLSGVVYLEVPKFNEKDEGAIKFGLHGYDYPIAVKPSAEVIHQPKRGDIALFPSSLFHQTIPFNKDSERMVVAFDLRPDNP